MAKSNVTKKKKNYFAGLAKHFSAWKQDNPTSWLTKAYVLAFLVIASLTLLSHNIITRLTERQIEGKEISYHLGQQIALVREISHYASSYYQNSEEFDSYLLQRAAEKLHESDKIVANYLDSKEYSNEPKEILRKIFREEPFMLDDKFKKYYTLVDEYAAYSPQSQTLDRKDSLKELKRYSEETFPKLLDMALTDYQTAQIAEMQATHRIENYAATTIIIVIILEAFFVFRPLVKRVDKYHRAILRLALEDHLTKLNNRRAFTRDLTFYRNVAARYKHKYVVALCDLDKFKSINDTYGHDVGDLVLCHFAKILKKSVRPSDIVARLGGEEFAIVLTNTGPESAVQVLERVRENTEKYTCPYGPADDIKHLPFTVSIGYVQGVHDDIESIEQTLKLADEALYSAKEKGRNRVIEFERAPVVKPQKPASPRQKPEESFSEIDLEKAGVHKLHKSN